MPDSNHRFRYAPGAAIQSDKKLKLLIGDIKNLRVLAPENMIPKNEEFLITVDVPTYKALNLIPLGPNKKVEATLLTVVTVINLPEDKVKEAKFIAGIKAIHGIPVRTPQRKRKFKEKFQHQTFQFRAGDFSEPRVTVAVRSVHHFFEEDDGEFDPMKVVTFLGRRSVVKLFEVDTK